MHVTPTHSLKHDFSSLPTRIRVVGYIYLVDFGPTTQPLIHTVNKQRRCSCELSASCPAIDAVTEYLKSGGQRAPDPMLPCPICGEETARDRKWDGKYTKELGWRCTTGGLSHFLQAKGDHVYYMRLACGHNPRCVRLGDAIAPLRPLDRSIDENLACVREGLARLAKAVPPDRQNQEPVSEFDRRVKHIVYLLVARRISPQTAINQLRGLVRPDEPFLPALISLSLLLAVLPFFTAYAHPLIEAIGGEQTGSERALTVTGILLQTGLLMGVVLFALRRWELPFGSLTLMFTLSTLLAVGIHENFEMLPVGVLSGLAADFLQAQLKPSTGNSGALRWFAFSVPVIFYTFYFATRAFTGSLDWTVHLWAGSIFLSGIAGLLMSYAIVPPFAAEK